MNGLFSFTQVNLSTIIEVMRILDLPRTGLTDNAKWGYTGLLHSDGPG